MPGEYRCWTESTGHSVEGHTNTATLYFKNQATPLWGPQGCHDNTVDIQTALRKADPRFELRLQRKAHTVEGHTLTFNIRANGVDLLRNLSCHDNMDSLATVINTIWSVDPPTPN